MKIVVTSQRREMLDHERGRCDVTCKPEVNPYDKGSLFIISKNKSLRMLASFH